MDVPFGKSAYDRAYGKMPPVRLQNRFFEENPTDQQTQTALLSRPGTKPLDGFGAGPIRGLFSLDGVFGGDLFVASGVDGSLFRYSRDGQTKTKLIGTLLGSGKVGLAATRNYLFIADGTSLQYYNGIGSFARGKLTATNNFSNNDEVRMGVQTYKFKTALTGAADEVLIGDDADASLKNLAAATLANGEGAGSVYTAATLPNADAYGVFDSSGVMTAIAVEAGPIGNSVATTTTATGASWEASLLQNGTADALNGITMPDDLSVTSLAVIAGYVLLVTAQSDRVYWIEPTSSTFGRPDLPEVKPLNFLSAEQLPDELIEVRVIGDEIWFFGVQSTEVWYVSGAQNLPFSRIKGRAFSRGIVPGSVAAIGSKVFVVGNDGVVYKVGGGLQRVSTHAIEEKIREQRRLERGS